MNQQGHNQEWEISKENVMPVKEGRSVDSLNQALQFGTPRRNKTLESKIQEQEKQIEDYIGSDPLSPWMNYIQWTKENCPTDTIAYMNVLERCIQKFSDSRLYASDFRFLKIWILYINLQSFENAKQSFSFMRSHSIGIKFAFFFLAEALVYEHNGEYEKTEKIYQEGITSCAEPLKEIIKHQKQFHRRMRRKCINLCADQQSKGQEIDPILQQVEKHGISMPAIRRLQEIQFQSKPSTQSNRNFGVLQEVRVSSTGTSFTPSQGIEVGPTTQADLPFSVYHEEAGEDSKGVSAQPCTPFKPASVQSKENEPFISKWSEVRLKQQPSVHKPKLSFALYYEPTQTTQPEQPAKPSQSALFTPKPVRKQLLRKESKQPFGYKRELFIRGDEVEDEIAFEEYRAQFYTQHTQLNQSSPQNQSSLMEVEELPPVKTDLVKQKLDFNETPSGKESRNPPMNEDMTINTRGALNELSDIFGNKDWQNKHENNRRFDLMSTVKKSQKRSSVPFSIYSTENPDVDAISDKENIPVSYKSQFSRPSINHVQPRKSVDSRHSVVGDVDTNDEGSITRDDSQFIHQCLSSQRSSNSNTNRISDVDESIPFMSGRRDTADLSLLQDLQEQWQNE